MDSSIHSNAGDLCSLADQCRSRGQLTDTMGTTALQQLETRTVGLSILSLAKVGTTVSADHLLQNGYNAPRTEANGLGDSLFAPGLLSV